MNLYRELRPVNWEEILGNEANIEQLKKFVADKNRPHAFLFTGESGCGKTTIARIFAKELGADDLTIKEINMADNRGIDGMRDIIDKMKYLPLSGKPIVYIFDEFHRATADAMSAMLKPFEDTPSHVYFILCTTDSQKILKTIKTRCTEIQVENIEFHKMFTYINRIVKLSNYNIEKVVIKAIAENSNGSVRKALVLLEQAITVEDLEQQLEIVKSGEVEQSEVIDLCRVLLKRNWKECSKILKNLKQQNVDSENIRYAILGYNTSVLLNKGDKQSAMIIECFSESTFNTKFSGIVLACFQACYLED